MILQLIALQVLIPVCLLAWLLLAKGIGVLRWGLRVVAVGAYLVALASAGLWTSIPLHLLLVYVLAYFYAGFRSWPGERTKREAGEGIGVMRLILHGAVAAGMLLLMLQALLGRQPARHVPIVDLEFPLRSGTYYVANGGSRQLINAHQMTLTDPRFRAYRGQSYGVDLVELGSTGFRAGGVAPADPSRYAIFGDTVYAPCAGEVVRAVDGLKDLSPPQVDREHMEGNHAILRCGEVWVLLGHLKFGSVRVATGQLVQARQAIGEVGNTGNSDEPHLHVHAQRAGTSETPLSSEPLQVRFSGRYLSRNSLVRRD